MLPDFCHYLQICRGPCTDALDLIQVLFGDKFCSSLHKIILKKFKRCFTPERIQLSTERGYHTAPWYSAHVIYAKNCPTTFYCIFQLHTGLICSRSFQNYAFKGWVSLETMKLWLLALTKTLFLMTLIIKLTLGNIFIKVKNPPGGATVTK